MTISSFDDLLVAARQQPLPQRLLFVVVAVELPPDSTPQQRADFEAGHGGALAPLMCVDKSPAELPDFAALADEAAQFGQAWTLVFTAALSGSAGLPPTSDDAQAPLQHMVESIRQGDLERFIAFNAQGEPLQLAS